MVNSWKECFIDILWADKHETPEDVWRNGKVSDLVQKIVSTFEWYSRTIKREALDVQYGCSKGTLFYDISISLLKTVIDFFYSKTLGRGNPKRKVKHFPTKCERLAMEWNWFLYHEGAHSWKANCKTLVTKRRRDSQWSVRDHPQGEFALEGVVATR
jgi:hypothetical protein